MRGLSPELFTKLWSAAPAKLAGLADRKGALAPGYDADIVVRSVGIKAAGQLSGHSSMLVMTSGCRCGILRLWQTRALHTCSTATT